MLKTKIDTTQKDVQEMLIAEKIRYTDTAKGVLSHFAAIVMKKEMREKNPVKKEILTKQLLELQAEQRNFYRIDDNARNILTAKIYKEYAPQVRKHTAKILRNK